MSFSDPSKPDPNITVGDQPQDSNPRADEAASIDSQPLDPEAVAPVAPPVAAAGEVSDSVSAPPAEPYAANPSYQQHPYYGQGGYASDPAYPAPADAYQQGGYASGQSGQSGYPQYGYQQYGYQQYGYGYQPSAGAENPYYQSVPAAVAGAPATASDPNAATGSYAPADPAAGQPSYPYYGSGSGGSWPPGGPDPVPPIPPKSGGGAGKAIAAGIAAGLVAGLLGGFGGYAIAAKTRYVGVVSNVPQSTPTNPGQLSPRADNSVAAIAKAMLPTTATIIARAGNPAEGGTGSGFVFSSDGYLVTNNHVINSAVSGGTVQVQFANEDPISAKIVGRSAPYDIAVIKVDKAGLTAARLGNSATVAVGDAAIAIGSPLGLSGTVTSGIISAINRPVTTGGEGEAAYISALQTDAPINPGNSGGPLVNSESQVVGVNSAIATLAPAFGSQQSGSIGLGFAIPINIAKRVAEEIIATGKASYPIIGVNVDLRYQEEGAKVSSVEPGSPAAKAGIQAGDVITAVNGSQVTSAADLLSVIRSFVPGDTVTLTIESPDGKSKDVKATLGAKTG